MEGATGTAEQRSYTGMLKGGVTLCLELPHVAQYSSRHTARRVCPLQGEGAAGTVEAVIIPVQRPRSSRPQRTTLCISSQVGCAQNCQFCLTGRMGLAGNLSTAQIVEQVAPLLTPLHRSRDPQAD